MFVVLKKHTRKVADTRVQGRSTAKVAFHPLSHTQGHVSASTDHTETLKIVVALTCGPAAWSDRVGDNCIISETYFRSLAKNRKSIE